MWTEVAAALCGNSRVSRDSSDGRCWLRINWSPIVKGVNVFKEMIARERKLLLVRIVIMKIESALFVSFKFNNIVQFAHV